MSGFKKFIARVFGIKTENVVVKKVVYAVSDKEWTAEGYKIVSDFLQTKVGRQLCDFLVSQKYAVASNAAHRLQKGDFWQGYAVGFGAAIDSILEFRQLDANSDSSDSGEVGLEELADKLDQ